MTAKKLTSAELQEITEFAKVWGKIIVRRAFGEHGPNLNIDITQMEQVAAAAAQGLTVGTLEEATALQSQQLADSQPCPVCATQCPVTSEERTIHVDRGTFQFREPKCHCPTCRRDFFPATSNSQVGNAQL